MKNQAWFEMLQLSTCPYKDENKTCMFVTGYSQVRPLRGHLKFQALQLHVSVVPISVMFLYYSIPYPIPSNVYSSYSIYKGMAGIER